MFRSRSNVNSGANTLAANRRLNGAAVGTATQFYRVFEDNGWPQLDRTSGMIIFDPPCRFRQKDNHSGQQAKSAHNAPTNPFQREKQ